MPNYCEQLCASYIYFIFSMIYQIPSASAFWILCLNSKSFSFPCFSLTEMAFFSYWFDLTTYGFYFIWLLFKDVCILTFCAYLLCITTYQLIFVLFSVVWVPFLHMEYPDWQPFIIETFPPPLMSFKKAFFRVTVLPLENTLITIVPVFLSTDVSWSRLLMAL